jgi:hypothetical protein
MRPLERKAQATILEVATRLQWRFVHFHDSRRQVVDRGGEARVIGDAAAKGWPDLTLVRDRVVYAEVKRQGEKPRPDQVVWLDALAAAGAEVYVWTLDDLEEINAILGSRSRFDCRRVPPRSAWVAGRGRRDA